MRTVLAIALVLGIPAGADDAGKPDVAPLIAQLSSPRFAEREAAQRALAELGAPLIYLGYADSVRRVAIPPGGDLVSHFDFATTAQPGGVIRLDLEASVANLPVAGPALFHADVAPGVLKLRYHYSGESSGKDCWSGRIDRTLEVRIAE